MSDGVRRAVGLAAAVLITSTSLPLTGAHAAGVTEADNNQATSTPVTLTVANVDPTTPAVGTKPHAITFTLTVQNNTGKTLSGVTISATRSDPITTQTALDSAIRSPKTPSDQRSDIPTTDKKPVTVATMAPDAARTVYFETTTSSDSTNPGICQCQDRIYPIYFTASAAGTELGHAQTYLPSFVTAPAKTQVAWVWPLLDRPHRLKQYNLFTDDDLATELGTNGRLDNLLDVVEQVANNGIPLTVITDPDLIDSLAVMSSAAGYKISTPHGYVKGTNGALAAAWLTRLRTILAEHKNIELDFTAYADPAVEALTRADLTWNATADSEAQQRITDALGRTGNTDINWPAHERLSDSTLDALATGGTTITILRDLYLENGSVQVPGTTGDKLARDVPADAATTLLTNTGSVMAAVTSNPIEQLVSRIVTAAPAQGYALLPQLVAQLAIRAENSFTESHFVAITPPRDLTVQEPHLAAQTIIQTSRTVWSQPVSLRVGVDEAEIVDGGPMRTWDAGSTLPTKTIAAVRNVNRQVPTASSLFADPNVAAARFGDMGVALQRIEATSMLSDRRRSVDLSKFLVAYVDKILGGVQLAKLYQGKNAVYTFASKDASLPVTVTNTLSAAVRIRVRVRPRDKDLGSLTSSPTRARLLNPGQRVQIPVVLHLKRVGQIQVTVQLENTNEKPLGNARQLTIRSTALGTIGVVITIVAGIVLVLAVVLRFARRGLRRRRTNAAPAE